MCRQRRRRGRARDMEPPSALDLFRVERARVGATRDARVLAGMIRAEALLNGPRAVHKLHDSRGHAGQHETLWGRGATAELGVAKRLITVQRLDRQGLAWYVAPHVPVPPAES